MRQLCRLLSYWHLPSLERRLVFQTAEVPDFAKEGGIDEETSNIRNRLDTLKSRIGTSLTPDQFREMQDLTDQAVKKHWPQVEAAVNEFIANGTKLPQKILRMLSVTKNGELDEYYTNSSNAIDGKAFAEILKLFRSIMFGRIEDMLKNRVLDDSAMDNTRRAQATDMLLQIMAEQARPNEPILKSLNLAQFEAAKIEFLTPDIRQLFTNQQGREALAIRMEENGVELALEETYRDSNSPTVQTEYRFRDIRILLGGTMSSIDPAFLGTDTKLEIKNMILVAGNNDNERIMIARMKNGCECNLVVAKLEKRQVVAEEPRQGRMEEPREEKMEGLGIMRPEYSIEPELGVFVTDLTEEAARALHFFPREQQLAILELSTDAGFHQAEYFLELPPNEQKILLPGDSFPDEVLEIFGADDWEGQIRGYIRINSVGEFEREMVEEEPLPTGDAIAVVDRPPPDRAAEPYYEITNSDVEDLKNAMPDEATAEKIHRFSPAKQEAILELAQSVDIGTTSATDFARTIYFLNLLPEEQEILLPGDSFSEEVLERFKEPDWKDQVDELLNRHTFEPEYQPKAEPVPTGGEPSEPLLEPMPGLPPASPLFSPREPSPPREITTKSIDRTEPQPGATGIAPSISEASLREISEIDPTFLGNVLPYLSFQEQERVVKEIAGKRRTKGKRNTMEKVRRETFHEEDEKMEKQKSQRKKKEVMKEPPISRITSVEFTQNEKTAGVTVLGDRPIAWTNYRDSQGRLIVELPYARMHAGIKSPLNFPFGLIKHIEIQQLDDKAPPTTRLTIEAREKSEHAITRNENDVQIQLERNETTKNPAEIHHLELRQEGEIAYIDVEADRPLVWTNYRDSLGNLVVELPNSVPAPGVGNVVTQQGLVFSVEIERLDDAERPLTRLVIRTRGESEHSLTTEGSILQLQILPAGYEEPVDLEYRPERAATEKKEEAFAGIHVYREQGTPDRQVPCPEVPGEKASELTEVSSTVKADRTEIRFSGNGVFYSRRFRMENPERLGIDLYGVVNKFSKSQEEITGSPAVERIRIDQFKPAPDAVTRIMFDLKDTAPERIWISVTPEGMTVSFPHQKEEEELRDETTSLQELLATMPRKDVFVDILKRLQKPGEWRSAPDILSILPEKYTPYSFTYYHGGDVVYARSGEGTYYAIQNLAGETPTVRDVSIDDDPVLQRIQDINILEAKYLDLLKNQRFINFTADILRQFPNLGTEFLAAVVGSEEIGAALREYFPDDAPDTISKFYSLIEENFDVLGPLINTVLQQEAGSITAMLEQFQIEGITLPEKVENFSDFKKVIEGITNHPMFKLASIAGVNELTIITKMRDMILGQLRENFDIRALFARGILENSRNSGKEISMEILKIMLRNPINKTNQQRWGLYDRMVSASRGKEFLS